MEQPDPISLRLVGEVHPESLKLPELTKLLGKLHDYLLGQILAEYSHVGRKDVHLSLSEVTNKSAGYGIHSSLQTEAHQAVLLFGQCLTSRHFSRLVPEGKDLARELVSIAKRHRCEAVLNHRDYSVIVTADTQIGGEKVIRGETQFYGTLERIGGATPKCVLRLSEQETLHADVSVELAKHLGRCLYAQVCLSGVAEWDVQRGSIESFRVTKVVPYDKGDIVSALEEIGSALDHRWLDDDQDELALVKKIRSGEYP